MAAVQTMKFDSVVLKKVIIKKQSFLGDNVKIFYEKYCNALGKTKKTFFQETFSHLKVHLCAKTRFNSWMA